MKLAIAMEKKYSKDEILQGYLNIVFFNNDAYGIEAAANFYFGVHAKDLTLPQAATAGRRGQQPGLLRPHHPPGATPTSGATLVLDNMLDQGRSRKADYDAAVKTPVTLKIHADHAGLRVRRRRPRTSATTSST